MAYDFLHASRSRERQPLGKKLCKGSAEKRLVRSPRADLCNCSDRQDPMAATRAKTWKVHGTTSPPARGFFPPAPCVHSALLAPCAPRCPRRARNETDEGAHKNGAPFFREASGKARHYLVRFWRFPTGKRGSAQVFFWPASGGQREGTQHGGSDDGRAGLIQQLLARSGEGEAATVVQRAVVSGAVWRRNVRPALLPSPVRKIPQPHERTPGLCRHGFAALGPLPARHPSRHPGGEQPHRHHNLWEEGDGESKRCE